MSHHRGVTSLVGYLGGNTAPHLRSTYLRSTYFTTNTTIVKVPANIIATLETKLMLATSLCCQLYGIAVLPLQVKRKTCMHFIAFGSL